MITAEEQVKLNNSRVDFLNIASLMRGQVFGIIILGTIMVHMVRPLGHTLISFILAMAIVTVIAAIVKEERAVVYALLGNFIIGIGGNGEIATAIGCIPILFGNFMIIRGYCRCVWKGLKKLFGAKS